MKLSTAASLLVIAGASINTSCAFAFVPHRVTITGTTGTASKKICSSDRPSKELFMSSAPSDVEIDDVEVDVNVDDNTDNSNNGNSNNDELPAGATPIIQARNDLIRKATELTSSSPTGLFITLPSDRAEFIKAIARLEAIGPTTSDLSEPLIIGEWELVATSRKTPLDAAVLNKNKDSSFLLPKLKLNPKIKNSIKVTQRIRSNQDIIDRVDNIIEFDNTSTNLLPAFLNPLSIDQSKIILIHKARVETFVPFRTKVALQSIVLNIAGQSQNLDPKGADIFGLNIPSLNEWMNSGEFDTTYVDESVRVSRGTIGFLDETRVFIRKGVALSDLHVDDHQDDIITNDVETPEEQQLEKFAKAVGGVADAVSELTNDVKNVIEKDLEFVADAVGELTNDVKNVIEKDLEFIKEDAEVTLQEIKDVVEDDVKDIEDAVLKVKSAIIGDEKMEEAIDNAVSAVTELEQDVEETIREAADSMKDTVNQDVEKIQDAVKDVTDAALKEEIEEVDVDGMEEVTPSTEIVDADNADVNVEAVKKDSKKKKGKQNKKKKD